MKNTQSKIKPIKTGKGVGCKDYTDNFKPQELKMRLEKNQIVLLVDLVNQDFKSKNTTTKNN